MRRRLVEPWTAEDDQRLVALAAQGASLLRASAAVKRSTHNVRNRARALGLTFPPLRVPRGAWTAPTDDR
jgi:hypothetical protein